MERVGSRIRMHKDKSLHIHIHIMLKPEELPKICPVPFLLAQYHSRFIGRYMEPCFGVMEGCITSI